MVYAVPYEADFECENGHKFTAKVHFSETSETVMCPQCWEDWKRENIPRGKQVSKPRLAENEFRITYD